MREFGLGAERRQDLWRRGLAEIEQPCLARTKSVGQKMAVRRHVLFRVMRKRAAFSNGNRGDDGTVLRRSRVRIDDAQKVAGLALPVAGPDEQIRTRRRRRAARDRGPDQDDAKPVAHAVSVPSPRTGESRGPSRRAWFLLLLT